MARAVGDGSTLFGFSCKILSSYMPEAVRVFQKKTKTKMSKLTSLLVD